MKSEEVNSVLTRKYKQSIQGNTTYPPVSFPNEKIDTQKWKDIFSLKFSEQNHVNGISLYIQLPYSQVPDLKVEDEYITIIEKEWSLYRHLMKQTPVIRELNLEGIPTFFSPRNLLRLLKFILKGSIIHPNHEFSLKGHPNNSSIDLLKVLHKVGFRRICYDVQDYESDVRYINSRMQTFENLKAATENAKSAGFTSVNFQLIYGIPYQSIGSIERMISKVIELMPERVSLYNNPYIPWTSNAQHPIDNPGHPSVEEKINFHLKGKELLIKNGYADIGMDHFTLPGDELHKAWTAGKIQRNFMGYTTQNSGLLLGLGLTGISDTGNAFAQNVRSFHDYSALINSGNLALKNVFSQGSKYLFKELYS